MGQRRSDRLWFISRHRQIESELLKLAIQGTNPEGYATGLPALELLIRERVQGVEHSDVMDAIKRLFKDGRLRLRKWNAPMTAEHIDYTGSNDNFFQRDIFLKANAIQQTVSRTD